MTDQALPLEQIRYSQTPYLPFDKRVGYHIPCVLPDKVLDNTQLVDRIFQTSLRQECSFKGLCFVSVFKACAAEGLYWAHVLTSLNPVSAKCIILTEAHLIYALPLDVRLKGKKAAQILRIMQAQARGLVPLRTPAKSAPAANLPPAPSVDLRANQDKGEQQYSVEVTVHDIPERWRQRDSADQSADEPLQAGSHSYMRIKPVAPDLYQQVLLRIMRKALKRQLAQTHNQTKALELKALCTLVAHVQEWQRQTRKRVVHVEECSWCARRQCWVWRLLLEIPKSLLVVPAVQAAAA